MLSYVQMKFYMRRNIEMTNEVLEVIESYNNYIKAVPAGSNTIATLLREEDTQQALQMILNFSDGMNWLVQATELLQQNDVPVEFEIIKVQEFLKEINNGLEIQDFVLVADMFEYEIAPFFEATNEVKDPQ